MGSSVSSLNNVGGQSNDRWWSIENEDYDLERPNLSELFDLMENKAEKLVITVTNSDLKVSIEDTSVSESHVSAEKDPEKPSTSREQTLEEFKEELRVKRIARQSAISDLRNEISNLKQQLAEEREINRKLRNGEAADIFKKDAATSMREEFELDGNQANSDHLADTAASAGERRPIALRSQLSDVQLALQLANADNLSLATELAVIRKQVASLKEVILCSKQMIEVREEQVTQLKAKLRQIEDSLAERELKIMSDNLRQEYDRQLANIRNLRQLYEERARVSAAERENLLRQISLKKDELATEIEKAKQLEERISSLETELETSNKSIDSLKAECAEFKFENKSLKDEMEVINKLFSQTLMGFHGSNSLDIDRLTTMLEENRTLLNEIATKEITSEGASLPKLLFDIVNQANDSDSEANTTEETATVNQPEVAKVATAQEIIGNLPKVWKVLMELLSHHKIEKVQFTENGQSEDCYKSVQTPTGPKAELSVSKTYIKLKDLILEKKSLQKETNKLKTLNSHLERRLNEQEKRLSTVSLELTKTWHLVGKMQRQHRQLHTHEQILRYQLHQKRRLLNELKDELEYCRRKWAAARAKNAESQIQCDNLRKEFAKRKLEDANTSAESGYSDGPVSDEEEGVFPTRKAIHDLFKNPKKIERRLSSSPTRSARAEILSRGQSAPPTTTFLAELVHVTDEMPTALPLQNVASTSIVLEKPTATIIHPPTSSKVVHSSCGAIPKEGVRLSRHKKREKPKKKDEESLEEMFSRLSGLSGEASTSKESEEEAKRNNRAERIHRLEEQCKSLIVQVIETSDCREKLEIQLCKFQEELGPVQHPIALENCVAKKIMDSDQNLCSTENHAGPVCSVDLENAEEVSITARAEEYANRRAERLKRLEEESKQLMSKIKQTSDRGDDMKMKLEQIRSRCSGNTEDSSANEIESVEENATTNPGRDNSLQQSTSEPKDVQDRPVRLTPQEEAYTSKRSERLKRLEEESKLLLSKLNHNAERGSRMNTRLDELHSRYGSETSEVEVSGTSADVMTNNGSSSDISLLTPQEISCTTRRDERLKRLEEQGKELQARLTNASNKGTELMNKLDELHEQAAAKVDNATTSESSAENDRNSEKIAQEDECTSKIEKVQRRLEASKRLLSQLSSESDIKSCSSRYNSTSSNDSTTEAACGTSEINQCSEETFEHEVAPPHMDQSSNDNETASSATQNTNESSK